MIFIVEKQKTWKGLSYVLKSSILKNAIIEKGLDCYVNLVYWTPQHQLSRKNDCSIIEAEYWEPNHNVDYFRFYIRTGVVPSVERKKVELIFINNVLPKLINWMTMKTNQLPIARQNQGMFCAYYRNGQLEINK